MNPGVHETHCCVFHGCKYGDDDCPVVTRKASQVYDCEDCRYPFPKQFQVFKTPKTIFHLIWEGSRVHDVRYVTDAPFNVGDMITYQEYDDVNRQYTGRETSRLVSSVTAGGCEGLPDNMCVVSLESR